MNASSSRVLQSVTLTALLIAAAWWTAWLLRSVAARFRFDDAYMFYRYAVHIRQGLGMSWNLDGVATYGETSLLWGLTVLLLSYLPLSMSAVLIFGSWLFSVGAIVAMAWAVAHNARSGYMSSTLRVLPMVAVPLVSMHVFQANAVTGMETMMATLLCALFTGLVLGWAEQGEHPALAAAVGLLLFLARPEAAIVVVVMPVLAYLLLPRAELKGLGTLLALFLVGVGLDLIGCRLYFGTPLPLSFYMKTQHGYEGYHTSWVPVTSAFKMVTSCWPYLLCFALCIRIVDIRRAVVCLAPGLLIFGYLFTVTQIMGWDARYYLPYLALFVTPTLLVLDQRLSARLSGEKQFRWPHRIGLILIGGAAAFLVLLTINRKIIKVRSLLYIADRRVEHREIAYDPVYFKVAARASLPAREWSTQFTKLADIVVKPLPKGSTIAASEVGYLGAAAPEVNVIDLAGLNDLKIAMHGFSMDELLARKPDLIWMPHTDYTYQRGVMLSSPGLLEQYDVLVGALGYTVALRKDSPVRPLLDRQMRSLWDDLYPGISMKDYLVKSASWSGRKHRIADNEAIDNAAEMDRFEPISQK